MAFLYHCGKLASDKQLCFTPAAAKRMRLLLFCVLLLQGEAFVPTFSCLRQYKTTLSANDSREEEARRLKDQAARIRSEVASFEQEKKNMARQEEEKQEEISSQKQLERLRYSAELPILKEDGSTVVQRVDFAPRIKDGKSMYLPFCCGVDPWLFVQ